MANPLDGVAAKIERAYEHITHLNADVARLLVAHPDPYKIVGQLQNESRDYVFTATGKMQIPLRFSVIAGEVLHQCRSALDHLVCALALEHSNAIGRQQFPVAATARKYEELLQAGYIKGVSRSAKKLIRAEQPYLRTEPGEATLMALHDLNNTDKHRLPVVVAATAKLGKEIIVDSGGGHASIEYLSPITITPVDERGIEIFRIGLSAPCPNFSAKADFTPQVAIEIPGPTRFAPLIEVLTRVARYTTKTVNKFVGEFPAHDVPSEDGAS